MNILFYGPFNYRSKDNESLMLKFRELGHKVYFLSIDEGYLIKDFLEKSGVECYTNKVDATGWTCIWKQFLYLRSFINRHKIDVVFSHLETANFIAVLTRYFVKARIVIVRHHVDEMKLAGADKSFTYRFAYKNAKHIIAVSEKAKQFMVDEEGLNADKISVINLSYDFNLFEKPDETVVQQLKERYPGKLLLLTACRLVKDKRPELSVSLAAELKEKGIPVMMLILGKGPMEDPLKEEVSARNLQDVCEVVGFRENILDYIAASDVLVHPSVLDSSSVIVKEAGLLNKTVIVCNGVGDFDTYIQTGKNGFLVGKETFVEETAKIIDTLVADRELLAATGSGLNADIHRLFDVNKNIAEYNQFLH